MNQPGVSLCMITRNEERFILPCLNSVEPFVQEIIVVDTGSTDLTQEQVLARGGTLLKLEWSDDFAQARNFALLHASCAWILVLDADETLEPVQLDYFNRLLTDEAAEGYFLNIININEEGRELSRDQVVRLFRNRPDYRFEGAIHEQIAPSILRHTGEQGLKLSDLNLRHLGYSERIVDQKAKSSRNMRIIKRSLTGNPGDAFLLYCLGLEYYQQDNITEGLSHLQKSLRLLSGSEGYFPDVLLALGSGYLQTAHWSELWELTNQALIMFPQNPDLRILRGLANLGRKKYPEALIDLKNGQQSREVSLFSDAKLNTLMGDIAKFQNDPAALDYYLNALKSAPYDLYPLCQIIGLWQKSSALWALEKVSQFVSPEKMLNLYVELKKREEYRALAPVLWLLGAYQVMTEEKWVSDWANWFSALLEDFPNQISLKSRKEKRKNDLLILTAKELKSTTPLLKKTFNPEHSSSLKKAKILSTELLYLYVMTMLERDPLFEVRCGIPE